MDLCGWTRDPQSSRVFTRPNYVPMTQNYDRYPPFTGKKISVKPDNINHPKTSFYYPQHQHPSITNFNQTQPFNLGRSEPQHQYMLTNSMSPVNFSNQPIKRNYDFNTPNSNGRYEQEKLYRSSQSMEPRLYSSFPIKNSKLEESTLKSTQSIFEESKTQQTNAELLRQNMQLKRIIEYEYKPLKNIYQKLKQEHQNRQYLVSQLEWKVKQLAKQIKSKKN